MPRNTDLFARDKQAPLLAKHRAVHKPPTEAVDQRRLEVWRLRTDERMTVAQIAKRLGVTIDTVYRDLNHKREQVLTAVSEYGQFRRRENERELEALKALYAGYIFNPNVVIRGTEVDADGKTRVVELSKFEAMLKVAPLYLAAINIQNKVWGLYTVPDPKACRDAPGTMNIRNVSIQMVEELRRIARNENLVLPAPIDANDA